MNFTTEQNKFICNLFEEYRKDIELKPEDLKSNIDYKSFIWYVEIDLANKDLHSKINDEEHDLFLTILKDRTDAQDYSDDLINAFKNALINQKET